jgi:hypothetical protein
MHQNQPEALIYISPANDNPANKLAAAEYQLISDRFQKAGTLFSAARPLIDEHFARIMDYHHPYLGTDFLQKNLAALPKILFWYIISAE